jgi:hypothetical protein
MLDLQTGNFFGETNVNLCGLPEELVKNVIKLIIDIKVRKIIVYKSRNIDENP